MINLSGQKQKTSSNHNLFRCIIYICMYNDAHAPEFYPLIDSISLKVERCRRQSLKLSFPRLR